MKLLMDLKDVAEALGVDYKTALLYVNRGMLRAVRLPSLKHEGEPRRKVQVRPKDLEAFIREHEIGTEIGTEIELDQRQMALNDKRQTGTRS